MTREEAYENLSAEHKALYEGSDERLDRLTDLMHEMKLSQDQRQDVVLTFGDTLLGIIKTTEYSNELEKSISADQAQKVHTVTKDLLPTQAGNTTPAAETSTIHTMADDVEKVQGYESLYGAEEDTPVHSSSQEHVLTQKVADTPQYDDTPKQTSEASDTGAEPDNRWQSSL